ncbi:uncharacterized protein LOC114841596 [Diachasma alloeum]|uniref:uncharacterized protein LOC114841596 n=1 Tax=Diachasma alloeum TaxID=454923 RepID=UPI0010FBB1C0|nr:uncharacterized protein LOC114841596 [Diachasma alloeum]
MWKQQRLVLLPKGKKPPDEPSLYHGLCMLDTAGKILERIVHQRIEAAAEPLLAGNQYGFRKGRSTLEAINLVVDTASEAIAGKRWLNGKKKYCLVATLDIKNAFNSAGWDYDVAVVIVGKYLEEINFTFDKAFEIIRRWMDSAGLNLAEHKTEAVLITSRKIIETITLQQAEHVGTKTFGVRSTLARLMPNIGGPKKRRRALLSSVVTSVVTYGISIWADVLQLQEARRKIAPVYRLSALRVASAYRTVSEDAEDSLGRNEQLRGGSRKGAQKQGTQEQGCSIDDKGIPIANIKGLASDNTNVMLGDKNSFASRLKN